MGVSDEFIWRLASASVPFESGANKLEVSFREGGLRLDKLFVTRGEDTPSGISAAADNCSIIPVL